MNCAVVDRGNMPPTVVNSAVNYIASSFISHKFKFEILVVRNDLCNGILCDGQAGIRANRIAVLPLRVATIQRWRHS